MPLSCRVLFSLFLASTLVLTGCGSGGAEAPVETPTPKPTEAPEPAEEEVTAEEVPAAEEDEGIAEETLEPRPTDEPISSPQPPLTETPDEVPSSPMDIGALRTREYTSEIVIEETLEPGSNYQRFIASYLSDGYIIYGLLTVPNGLEMAGYPAIVFLHGYLPPDTYVTTARYVAYQDRLASSGFVTLKPDLRGHGASEGVASGALFSEAYTVDTLNAISALESYEYADPNRIGLWGHSNGGATGLRVMVITEKAKAGVFWAGVVGSYPDMLETYISEISFLQRSSRVVIEQYGSPGDNPDYWGRIDPYAYLETISGPIQLHHGTADSSVPIVLSMSLRNALQENGKVVEIYEYEGADHNISGASYDQAMDRTVEFFEEHLR
ncbi:MAG: alpha/beta fold hydrolase [Anaerolineae bacterium]|nr:alpha/beta fold hydrolase [Anaerolineae bacterium]